jgi:hypothetical protein
LIIILIATRLLGFLPVSSIEAVCGGDAWVIAGSLYAMDISLREIDPVRALINPIETTFDEMNYPAACGGVSDR